MIEWLLFKTQIGDWALALFERLTGRGLSIQDRRLIVVAVADLS